MCGASVAVESVACHACGEALKPPQHKVESDIALQRAFVVAALGGILGMPLLNLYSLYQLRKWKRGKTRQGHEIDWHYDALLVLNWGIIVIVPLAIGLFVALS